MNEFEGYAKAKAHRILKAKNIAPLLESIAILPHIPSSIYSENGIHITALDSALTLQHSQMLHSLALQLKPWRKGGFYLFDLHIDSEWQSFMKWQLLAPHCELSGKHIADIGCNNGYYMFEMLLHKQKMLNFYEDSKTPNNLPKSITGFDPSGIFKAQFDFLNHFVKAPIDFELLGVEDMPMYCQSRQKAFDVIFCLGVLYHRLSPIETLKSLSQCLERGGELILDTLIYESSQELCLSPAKSYAKMSNVYFIPSIPTLQGWCERAKFKHFELLALMPTTTQEQRQTPWVDSQSLESFLQQDKTLTIEGYQAPVRGYFKLKKE